MAALDTRGFYPDTSPNQALFKIADTLQENVRYKQERDYRNQKEKEADDYKKYNVLKSTIDPEDVATGNASADDYFGQETKRVFNEIISDPKLGKMSYADLYGTIQSKWQPLVQSAGKIKNGLLQIDATVKAAGQEDTNLATEKLAPAAKLKFIDSIMPVGEGGKRTYNTAGFNPDKNHVLDILESDDYWRYMKGADPLVKYIQGHKTEDVNLERHQKDKSIIPYKGKKSAFSELNITPGDFGVITGVQEPSFDVATENDFITDDGGNQIPVKLLRSDIYKAHVEDVDANRKSLDYLWNKYKEANGIKSKNATEEEKRKRAFAVGVFQAHDPSQIPRGTSQHLPSNRTYNTTNVNTGGNKNAGGDWADAAEKSIKSGDEASIKSVFGQLISGDKNDFGGVEVKNGRVFVKYKTYPSQSLLGGYIDPKDRDDLQFDVNSPDLNNFLRRTWQRMMGGDAVTEKSSRPSPKTGYTQVTETNKGTIGVKNGNWYYTKTGKPVEQ